MDAYVARIEALRARGLIEEAKALAELVAQRYGVGGERLAPLRLALAAAAGDLASLVAPLGDPDLADHRRRAIEETIRRELTELSGLAQCRALAGDHPLRKAAAALAQALEAVTTRPVTDAELALPEVWRRSPLAPWKLLVRAIACFYRREDDTCAKLLDAIDADSAPARLVPGLRAMLAPKGGPALQPAAAELRAAVVGHDHRALRAVLTDLDKVLESRETRKVPAAIRRAVRTCQKARPGLVLRLKQHISARCVLAEVPARRPMAAMGGPARQDAYCWRLFARAMEIQGDVPLACTAWEEFRKAGAAEGWFPQRGWESAALYLHMADLVRRVPSDILERIRRPRAQVFYSPHGPDAGESAPAPGKSAQGRDHFFLYPERLYERACSQVPDAEAFARWLEYVQTQSRAAKKAERVALQWHVALPRDTRPLLYLMESAEKRKAYTKALKYLKATEAVDALSPEVKRARLRLGISKALRHLKQRKCHLAEKDFAELADLPQRREGDRPAFLAALRWASARMAGESPCAREHRDEVVRLLGDKAAAAVLLAGVIQAAGGGRRIDPLPDLPPSGDLLRGVGRYCLLCRDVAVAFDIPRQWEGPLMQALAEDCRLDAAALEALARAALDGHLEDLAFAASGVGLRRGGPHAGRFLLLRGRSVPPHPYWRREECFTVAAELARRQRDMDLVAEVVDARRGGYGRWALAIYEPPELRVSEEKLTAVLEREKQAPGRFAFVEPCPVLDDDDECADGRPIPSRPRGSSRRRSPPRAAREGPEQGVLFDDLFEESDDDFDDEESDDFDDDLDSDLEDAFDAGPPPGADLPPDVAAELEEVVKELMANGRRMPTARELDRALKKHPGLAQELMRVLFEMASDGRDPFEGFDAGPFRRGKRSRPQRRRRH